MYPLYIISVYLQDSDEARIFPSIESYPLFTHSGYKCAPSSVEVKCEIYELVGRRHKRLIINLLVLNLTKLKSSYFTYKQFGACLYPKSLLINNRALDIVHTDLPPPHSLISHNNSNVDAASRTSALWSC